MCELFALSARRPATVTLSLAELARHGGLTGPHADGWGVSWYEGAGARLLREAAPAAQSGLVRFLLNAEITSTAVLCHIRKATRGDRSLANTQPFRRELGGREHIFAHNGDLPEIDALARGATGRWRPVGETDSELAFLVLLERLRELWERSEPPPLEERFEIFAAFARDLARLGPANFIYSDGDVVFGHGNKRTQAHRNRVVEPPGLHLLQRRCTEPDVHHDLEGVHILTGKAERR